MVTVRNPLFPEMERRVLKLFHFDHAEDSSLIASEGNWKGQMRFLHNPLLLCSLSFQVFLFLLLLLFFSFFAGNVGILHLSVGESFPMLRAKRQSFFKVFLLQHSARRMKIPPEYRRHMNGKNFGTVYLSGPSGNRWAVKLINENGELYLARGWPTFVMDNAIRQSHFLVFKFDGVDTFKVKIYSPTGCEEKASFRAKPSRSGDDTNPIKPVKGHAPVVKEEEEEEDAWNSTVKCLLPAPSAAAYPNFVVKLKAYSVQDPSKGMTVGIPSSFLRTHMSHFVEQSTPITLRWADKEWPASVTRTKGRSYLCGGWRDFVKDSRVRAGDSCRFELLKQHLLRVHILKITRFE